ncbi:biofilm formation regulator BssR [Helicobacter sp. MIT 14-3879]|uniref:biofilm formation regulator BssR n=1 Tax=Helicobacter sp. MIT 14-3879 TaxID=2040649 RepID=UPI000E1F94DE|nr:flagellar biosynthesis anti-sigma factor FlgM [Helicobacter sp. MIT 14-3879]RDU61740.1 hypothetical protein CQA44_08115 [Helicobacter sp. MIT 14-3879]
MRVASSVMASVQQAQNRDTRNELNRNVQDKIIAEKNVLEQEKASTLNRAEKAHDDKIAKIKEDIRNGTYKLDLAATSEKMAQSLLNV